MAKCTKACFLSFKEPELLPTEEGCLRNCFVKGEQFKVYMENELRYTVRNYHNEQHLKEQHF